MRKILTILFLAATLVAQAQQKQIAYIEATKNWYYLYDQNGKQIKGLSRSSTGEIKGWGSDYFVTKRYSFYFICDINGRTLKSLNVSDVGEIVAVSGEFFTSRKGSWVYTWNKNGKKINARTAR